MKKKILTGIVLIAFAFVLLSACLPIPSEIPEINPDEVRTDIDWPVNTIVAWGWPTFAIQSDGSLWAWGRHENGRIGDGTRDGKHLTPIRIMDDVVSVGRTQAICTDGILWVWGNNLYGQLGDGTTTNHYSPTQIMDSVVYASVGASWGSPIVSYTMAIRADSSLWAWGGNWSGQIGNGTAGRGRSQRTPIRIMEDVVAVSTSWHTLAIQSDGSLWAWGPNDSGQLGDGTTENRHSPVQVMEDVAAVSAGNGHTLAIRTDGSLWAWGSNRFGQLGDGTTEDRHSPVQVMEDVAAVSVGSGHTLAIRTDGSLWAWGWNEWGRLGDGTTEDRHSPVMVMEDVVAVSASSHTLAIQSDGSLWAWGYNSSGQLGNGTATGRHRAYPNPSPIRIMEDVVAVFAGGSHTLAIRTDGSLWVWGDNSSGQLGDGTTEDRHSPVMVMEDVMIGER